MSSIVKIACVLLFFWNTSAHADLFDVLKQVNQGLEAANAALGGPPPVRSTPNNVVNTGPAEPVMAIHPADATQAETQLIIPPDTRTRAAIEEALPTVKKILSIHQCIKTGGMTQLNFWAVPGVDIGRIYYWPNSPANMRYHDRNKCVSIRSLDSWTMPALNALKFRAVYFATDSGETVNFFYLMKKMDDGSWKLAYLSDNEYFYGVNP